MGALASCRSTAGAAYLDGLRFAGEAARHPWVFARSLSTRRWSERTVIALVMQTSDNSITVERKRGLLGWRLLTSKQGHGEPKPTYIPEGNVAVGRWRSDSNAPGGERAWPGRRPGRSSTSR